MVASATHALWQQTDAVAIWVQEHLRSIFEAASPVPVSTAACPDAVPIWVHGAAALRIAGAGSVLRAVERAGGKLVLPLVQEAGHGLSRCPR